MTAKNNGCRFSWNGKDEAIAAFERPANGFLRFLKDESNFNDATENMFIEGDNLDVLKHLRETHSGKVRVIYIDPPYNKGGRYVFRDSFGDAHCEWLSMVYPRLAAARDLLSDDGAIFVSIDDKEVHNLRMLLNEVFGEENYIATVIWEKKFSPQNDARWFSDNHDYVLIYARDKSIWRPKLLPRTDASDARYKNPDNDPRGPWTSSDLTVKTYNKEYDYQITTPAGRKVKPPSGRCWGMSRESFMKLVKENRIWFGTKGSSVPRLKRFLSEVKQGLTPCTIWTRDEVGDNQEARRSIREIFGDVGVFETPKPVRLIQRILQLATEPTRGDVVLDFFAGSCTTAHAVLKQNSEDGGNRRFIMVQIPEKVPGNSRAYEIGFRTVSQIGAERIARVLKIKSFAETSPGFKYLRLERPTSLRND